YRRRLNLDRLGKGWDKDRIANTMIGLEAAQTLVADGTISQREMDEIVKKHTLELISNAIQVEQYVAMRKSGEMDQLLERCAETTLSNDGKSMDEYVAARRSRDELLPDVSDKTIAQQRAELTNKVGAELLHRMADAGVIDDKNYVGALIGFK